jgi:hypothetical protein
VAIFVPPAILDEMQAVFDLPMSTNVRLKLGGCHQLRIEAGYEVPAFVGKNVPCGRAHFTIDADGNLAMRKIQALADIRGIVQVDPKPACFMVEPLFSVVSWEGLPIDASAKQVFNASSTSG